ncbi:MAG: hypothetical protein JKY54_00795 [Flavobacteriales bacterium]|nr:hypothetical protein [Flavobacteriales bacterium]
MEDSKKNSVLRVDRDLSENLNVLSLYDEYGKDYYEVINDLARFISFKMQSSQTNIFGTYNFTLKEFSAFSGRSKSSLQTVVKVKDNEGNDTKEPNIIDVLTIGKTENGNELTIQIANKLEHSLNKMMQSINLKKVSNYRDKVEIQYQNFSYISGYKVTVEKFNSKERIYEITPNMNYIGALVKSYEHRNNNDYIQIKSKKTSYYLLYDYLCKLQEISYNLYDKGELKNLI